MTAEPPPPRLRILPGQTARDFPAIYAEHHDFVRRTVRALGVPDHAADDVTQDVFVIVHRRLPGFDHRAPVKAWVFGIARNLVRAAHRQTTHYELTDFPADDDFAVIELRAALSSLSEADQEVLTLIAWHGLAAAEAAQVLGCTTATFFVRLHRARRRLQAALWTPKFDSARESWKTS